MNGKIKDTNSSHFAKTCFSLGLDLKKIIVVGDEEEDIIAGVQELHHKYDLVITTGGIGSTHDDITYPSIAKAFDMEIQQDQYLVERMTQLNAKKRRERNLPPRTLNSAQRNAELRMATLPIGSRAASYYVDAKLWVPIVAVDHKVFVFPGIPELFELLLAGLLPHLIPRINHHDNESSGAYLRYYVKTAVGESEMAPLLGEWQQLSDERLGVGAVKIGSYPHMAHRVNTVSIIARAQHRQQARDIVEKAVTAFNGEEIDAASEAKLLEPSL